MSGTTTRTVGGLPAVTTLPAGSEVVALVADATVSGGRAARRAPATAFQGPQGAAGTPGTAGATGTAGAAGPAGASMRSGTGTPAAALGANGDSYVDGATGAVYQKTGGAWAQISGASLRGPTGPAGTGGTGTTDGIDPAALPAGSALSATDEAVIIQGGEAKRATLAAIATAAGISPGALPVAGALAGANEVHVTQGGNVTRLTLDGLVTYLQGRLGTSSGGGGTGTGGTTPAWTLRADYTPTGGLTGFGGLGPEWYDRGNAWRVSADNRLECDAIPYEPWAERYLVRANDTNTVNQRIIARFTHRADAAFHLYGRVVAPVEGVSGLACQLQGDGNFGVEAVVNGIKNATAYNALGQHVPADGATYDMRADFVQNGASTTVAVTLFAVPTATAALGSGTQLSAVSIAYTGADLQNSAGSAGMYWYAVTENTPTFVQRFAWYAG